MTAPAVALEACRPGLAGAHGAAHRPGLHAAVHRRRPRPRARAGDDRGGGRRRDHRVRHRARLRPRRRRARPQRATAGRRAADAAAPRATAPHRDQGRHDPRRAGRGCPTAAPRPSAPTARRASPPSTACPSTPTFCTPPTRARRGRRRCARWPGCTPMASSPGSGSPTSTAANSTRRSSSRPISAVQVALSVFDDGPLRGGLVERCGELGITLIAHSPLGGRAGGPVAGRGAALAEVADRHSAPSGRGRAGLAAGALPRRGRHPRRPAPRDGAQRGPRGGAHPHRCRGGRAGRARAPADAGTGAPTRHDADVVMVMGIPGAGKTRLAADYVARGYERLNRDERGGSLRDIAQTLDERLARGRGGSSWTTPTSPAPRAAT